MKRILLSILVLSFVLLVPSSDAQRRRRGSSVATSSAGSGKVAIPCPRRLTKIEQCPDTGCGPSLDPKLNQRKNIRSDDSTAETMTIAEIKDLPDPVAGYAIGDDRDKLTALGEGKKITVEAWALVARKGGGESCNCKLLTPRDTDNHIVLVDPSVRSPTLARNEDSSITAEFTPRVRLDHPNLARPNLQSLITSGGGKRKVRITGLLMFDSEHSLGHHLKRDNNWEIHPVLGLQYCPRTTCTESQWKDIEQ